MGVSDTVWHLIIRVRAHGTGMGRRLDYDLSDVIRHTHEGADHLAGWAERRPGEVGLWLSWSPLRGVVGCGVTPNAPEVGYGLRLELETSPSLRRAVLAGISLAMRIDSGEFGPCDRASASRPAFFGGPDANDHLDGAELIDPDTLEIKDGE